MSTRSWRDGASHGAAGQSGSDWKHSRPHRRRARRRAHLKGDDHETFYIYSYSLPASIEIPAARHGAYAGIGVPGFGVTDEAHGP